MTERYIIINHATPKKDVVTLLEKFATILGIIEPSDRYEFIGESLRYEIPFFFQSGIEYVSGDVALSDEHGCYSVDIEKGTYFNSEDLIVGDRVNIEASETEIERQRKDIVGFVNSIADSTQYTEEIRLDLLRGALLKQLRISMDNVISDSEVIAIQRWMDEEDADFDDSQLLGVIKAWN